jgi:hypothetical protein
MPRHTKKRSLKRRHHKKRTMRGGYYGANGAIAPGAMEWKAGSEMGDFVANRGSNSTINGAPKPMQYGRGRKGKKGRKTSKRRSMRGGGSFGAVSASYAGPQGYKGSGPPDVVAVTTKGPAHHGVAKHGAFNDNGAHSGNFSAFKGLLPK